MKNFDDIEQYKLNNPDISDTISEIQSIYDLTIRHINHEFGNALTLINSSLQHIQSSHPEVNNIKYWDSTMEDVQYLVKLVSDVSNLYNYSNARKEKFDINAQIEGVIVSVSQLLSDTDISIHFEKNKDIPLYTGYNSKIRQVFINLIKNAYEAIDQKGEINIKTDINQSDNYITVEISDTGCGIPEEYINSIFKPLVSHKRNGCGLGLAISNKIIAHHNGQITVKSSPGTGTTFTIFLPII